ncbi:NUDIX domain-containing protein [Streptomyces sp. NPDC055056]
MPYPDDPVPNRPASGRCTMNGQQRRTEPVDVRLILRRETASGPQMLLSRRAGRVYAAALWHLPSGHRGGPHEDVVTALVREAREETGVVIDPADVRAERSGWWDGSADVTRRGLW